MTTLTYNVGASTDDGYTNNHDASIGTDLTAEFLRAGHVGDANTTAGARFLGIAVAQGVTITSATLVLTGQDTYHSGGTISVKVACEAADTTATFVGGAAKTFNEAARPRTTLSSAWDIHNIVAGTEYSKDITAQVQEVISRAGWVSGNSIVVLIDNNASTTSEWSQFYAWDDATNRAKDARLVIVVPAAGAIQPPRSMHQFRMRRV